MTINELIEECERLDDSPKVDFARSLALLPLLVKVIKNQQRQIEWANARLRDQMIRFGVEGFSLGESVMENALKSIRDIAAELEDIK